jgi:putative lipoic acid-binding regulatory protein
MFKFIVKSKSFQIEKLKNLFNKSQKEVSLVNSSKNTYQSLTIKIQMESPDEVIDIYKKVGQFDDVIIL